MPPHPLYAIADSKSLGESLLTASEAALRGGVPWLQYRDKSNNSIRRKAEAQALAGLCQRYGAQLIINDDVTLAGEIGAGVHLGQSDGDPVDARRQLGPTSLIGVTCHDSLDLARQAQRAGADYVAFGRFFASRTKPEAPPAPISLLQRARRAMPTLSIVAIGGITLERGQQLLDAGACRLAVSHDLFQTGDTEHRARAFGALTPSREKMR